MSCICYGLCKGSIRGGILVAVARVAQVVRDPDRRLLLDGDAEHGGGLAFLGDPLLVAVADGGVGHALGVAVKLEDFKVAAVVVQAVAPSVAVVAAVLGQSKDGALLLVAALDPRHRLELDRLLVGPAAHAAARIDVVDALGSRTGAECCR